MDNDEKKLLVKDFKVWSGGFLPNETSAAEIESYIENSLPTHFNQKEAQQLLRSADINWANIAKSHSST